MAIRDKLGNEFKVGDLLAVRMIDGTNVVYVMGRAIEITDGGIIVGAAGHKGKATVTKPLVKVVVYVDCDVNPQTRMSECVLKVVDPNPEVAESIRGADDNPNGGKVSLN